MDKSEAARAMGEIKTEKKAASSRENGKLGGWQGNGGLKPIGQIPCTCGRNASPHLSSCRISRTLYQRERRKQGKR